jgi:cobalt-zinc-cadmium efflux system membrane fusion protein
MRTLVASVLCALTGAGGAYWYATAASGRQGSPPNCDHSAPSAYCTTHELDEARCPFCNPALVTDEGECGEHGVPEVLCYRCHPELAVAFKAEGDWCNEHQLPESQDELCNPGALARPEAGQAEPIRHAPALSLEPDPPEDLPRSERAPSVTCTKDRTVVRLASAELAREIGLESEPVRRQPLRQTLTVNAEVVYDGTRFARLASRAAGVIAQVHKNVGDAVRCGEVLAVVDSSDVGGAKAALLAATATVRLWENNHEREQALWQRGVATEREALETETKLAECRIELARARQRLANLGLSDAQIERLVATEDASSLLELTAPFDGLVVERAATVGEVVDTSKPLLAVADIARMWAMLDLAPAELPQVQVGQAVVLTIDGLRGEAFAGRIVSVNSQAEVRTRTIKARAEIENPDGLLRAKSFGRAEIAIRSGEPALLVPRAAVQWDGCCNVAFVQDSETRYRARKLRLGCDAGDFYEVLAGLNGDETVVTQGSFLLKTEILKGSIGAGCCEVDHLAK